MLGLFLLPCVLAFRGEPPAGPQGPSGAMLSADLLAGDYEGAAMGAFNLVSWEPGHVNDELQWYVPEAAIQDPSTGAVTITAQKDGNGKITSARMESHNLWSTATSPDTKLRGYLEVRANIPAKVDGGSLKGSWPAIWMLGTGNGWEWPKHGELDIVEAVNGNPTIVMSAHSTHHHNGEPQHPPNQPFRMNADFTEDQLIAGFEWNVQEEAGQIDMTWWMTWWDLSSQTWESKHSTLVIGSWDGNSDYWDFLGSFTGEGFSLLINLAEGGAMPGTDQVFVDGQPQYLVVHSAKAYHF